MYRLLEQFRAAYLRITRDPTPEPDVVGPSIKREEDDDDDSGSDDHHDPQGHQSKHYQLVVKREEY